MSDNPGEVVGGVFLSSISVPASVSNGFSRNITELGVCNGDVDVSSSIILDSMWASVPSRVWALGVSDKRSYNPGEVRGGVFLSSVWVPAGVSNSLGWDISMLGVSNSDKWIFSIVLSSEVSSISWWSSGVS